MEERQYGSWLGPIYIVIVIGVLVATLLPMRWDGQAQIAAIKSCASGGAGVEYETEMRVATIEVESIQHVDDLATCMFWDKGKQVMIVVHDPERPAIGKAAREVRVHDIVGFEYWPTKGDHNGIVWFGEVLHLRYSAPSGPQT